MMPTGCVVHEKTFHLYINGSITTIHFFTKKSNCMTLETREYLQRLLRFHGVWLRKSLGQHLLVDDTALEDIASAACPEPGCSVVEIGAGAGSLTVALLARKASVTGIELDTRFTEIHKELCASWAAANNPETLDFFYGDALDFDYAKAAEKAREQGRPFVIAGNIPYQITSPLIMKIIEDAVAFDSMTLMMQLEVAQRLTAKPRTRTIGSISVKVQYFCEIEQIRDVGNRSFLPPPKVQSRVLRFKRRTGINPDPKACKRLFNLIDAGYRYRRKVLPNSIGTSGMYHWDKATAEKALLEIGLSPNTRAEELGIAEWEKLLQALDQTRPEK